MRLVLLAMILLTGCATSLTPGAKDAFFLRVRLAPLQLASRE